ncbi:MAG: hypothetical protein P1U34_11745 [Coxiellaceae bacterium]|nr:hypothetical protein [Coxiellaceae bacterium]
MIKVENIEKRGWRKFYFESQMQRQFKYPKGYMHKVRINLLEGDYEALRDKLIDYLVPDDPTANEAYFEHRGLHVVRQFKIAKDAYKKKWAKEDGYLLNNKQFTIYLQNDVSNEDLRSFIDKLQAFLTSENAKPATPSMNDYAVAGCANISMRLDIINGKGVKSDKLTTRRDYREAYHRLQRDSSAHDYFNKGIAVRASEFDAIHELMAHGFRLVESQITNIGALCQAIASDFRQMQCCILDKNVEQVRSHLVAVKQSMKQLLQHAKGQSLRSGMVELYLYKAAEQVMGAVGKKYIGSIKEEYTLQTQSSCCYAFSTLFSRPSQRPAVRLRKNREAEEALLQTYLDSIGGAAEELSY